jgi:uncharacterized protein (DUF1330 family)
MSTPKGYIYAELDVTDPTTFYEEYMPAVRPILAEYDAKFLIATNDVKVIEGGRDVKRIILLEFDSPETARAFFYSKAYQDILDLRLKSSSAHLYHLDGVTEG